MTSKQQQEELFRHIWRIANQVRGAVDGWDFKQFVLGSLFYRFLSENFTAYMEIGDEGVDYAARTDDSIPLEARCGAVEAKGYFIAPSQTMMSSLTCGSSRTSTPAIRKPLRPSRTGTI